MWIRVVLVVLGAAAGILLYESVKELYFPELNKWESHTVSIVVCSVISAVAALLALRYRSLAGARIRRLAAIVESSDDAIIGKDLDGVITSWNRAAERIYGYEESEVLGKSISMLVPPDRQDELSRLMERLRYGEQIEHYETERLRKDGSTVDISLTLSPIRDDGGEIVGISSIASDVSESKRAETALRASQAKYRTLHDSSSDAIMLVTPHAEFISGNPAAIELFGCHDEEELLRYTPAGLSPEYQPDGMLSSMKVQQMMNAAIEEGSNFFEWVHRRTDGSEFPARVLLVRMELEGKAVLQATVRDITVQKNVEEAVRRERAKLWAMISGMEEGVVFADANDVIIEINDFLCRFVGVTRDKIVGKRIKDLHVGEVLENVLRHIDRFRKEIGCSPFVLQRPLGSAEVILRMQPIYRDGGYDGVLLNVIDVTELVTARREAEAATEAKSKFLANMSHEIRTPMTSILGYTDLLADPTIGPAERKDYLSVIRRCGEHLLSLINDILDLSKIEAGKTTVEMGSCNVAALLANVASMMRPRAEQRGNSLAVEYDGPLPETIQTDCARLRQAVVNLVGNAVKFTENGTVRILVEFLRSWREGQSAVKIEVIDTGIGIREEAMPSLFRPFSQGDTSIARRFGGTGLGLAISHHVAGLLGGELVAASTFGEGSTFTLTVPTGELRGVRIVEHPAEAAIESARDSGRSSAADLTGIRILLAEDGVDNQNLIRAILGKAGAEVEIAENGRVATERAEAATFDVILMDMNMPEMDGYEATRLLRDRGYRRPILALTANAMAGDNQQCLAAGCDDHLTKPIDRAQLIQSIARYARKGDVSVVPPVESGKEVETGEGDAIVSEYADDPDMTEIMGEFVMGLGGHVSAMRRALTRGEYDELRRQAHTLKGAGGGYGYPGLTTAAAALESAAKAEDGGTAALALERVATVCRAVRKGYVVEEVPAG